MRRCWNPSSKIKSDDVPSFPDNRRALRQRSGPTPSQDSGNSRCKRAGSSPTVSQESIVWGALMTGVLSFRLYPLVKKAISLPWSLRRLPTSSAMGVFPVPPAWIPPMLIVGFPGFFDILGRASYTKLRVRTTAPYRTASGKSKAVCKSCFMGVYE